MLLIVTTSLALHLIAALILWRRVKHQRQQRHQATLPLIGSDPALTDALHLSLCRNHPETDWLSLPIMRTKLTRWRNQAAQAEQAEQLAHQS